MRLFLCATLYLPSLIASAGDVKLIQERYMASYAAIPKLQTPADVERLTDSFQSPEWVGNMPAGETLTRADSIAEGNSILNIPIDKRPKPRIQFIWSTETGWSILVVYWLYREVDGTIVGALYKDTWVRTAQGWLRTRTDKPFPDRVLARNSEAVLLPPLH